MRRTLIAFAGLLASCINEPQVPPTAQPLILSGSLSRADHQTYRELPFTVPAGVGAISIDFAYTNQENRTVIDLGVRDPNGQRGWSGGNKSHIEIGAFDASPSYRPGKIEPGTWILVLGVPNIRAGEIAHFEATITFLAHAEGQPRPHLADLSRPLRPEPGWRRGDFHTHTWHSDGSCALDHVVRDGSASLRLPCPAIYTFEAARDANLDFVAITDHNTVSQLADIREQQLNFPTTLLIPGAEVTTFQGHANAIGVADFVDFQLGSFRLPTLTRLFDEVDAQGGFISINHPGLPSGEICMGCGWTVADTDYSRLSAVEAINGSTLRSGGPDGPTSGIRFWDRQLKQGARLVAIGGSDNHDATDRTGVRQSPIGKPTTVVYANELSARAIVAGVKSGRVFIDIAGLPGAVLDMETGAGEARTYMGGEVRLARDEIAAVRIMRPVIAGGSKLILVSENLATASALSLPSPIAEQLVEQTTIQLKPGADFGYLRAEVRAPDGALLLLGNPIFIRSK
jgi:hypothetical protein